MKETFLGNGYVSVRWETAIWCEPSFFVEWVMGLALLAKNEGWQIALIFWFFCIKTKERKKKVTNATGASLSAIVIELN